MQGSMDLNAMKIAALKAKTLLSTLANEDRLLLLCVLSQREYAVFELEEVLGIKQPTLSQQLGVLRKEGLVSIRKEGRSNHYSVASGEVLAILQLLYQLYCEEK